MLDCSEQWVLEIEEGIEIRRLAPGALRPPGNRGQLLVASRADGSPIALRPNAIQHTAVLKRDAGGDAKREWLIRVTPGINLLAEGAKDIRLHSGSTSTHIVSHGLTAPGETAFLATPAPPNNLAGTLATADMSPLELSASSPGSTELFLDCSEEWKIEVEAGSGITLQKLKKGAHMPNDAGEILSAKVRTSGTVAQGAPLNMSIDRGQHTAKVTAGTAPNLDEWLIRVADGITVKKDPADSTAARLVVKKPRNIVDVSLSAPSEVGFAQVPVKKRGEMKPDDFEDVPA
jgi:hypothetical protein